MTTANDADAARTLHVLVVGPETELGDELREALRATTDTRVSLRQSFDYAEAGDAVRSRQPDLVCVELGADADALRGFVASVRAMAPDLPFVGVQARSSDGDAAGRDVLVEALRTGFVDVIERPVSSADLRRVWPKVVAASRDLHAQGHVVAFHSTKGGVGKSTLSVNVAAGLARNRPDRVLLIDASLQLGVCAAALDLSPRTTLADAARERDRLDETLLREFSARHECGLRVLASPYNPIDAADVDDESLARIIAIGRRAFDFVIVDTLPTVDGTMLTILDLADRIFLVNQGTVPDVIGAARLLETLDELGIGEDRRSVVLNHNLPRFTGALTADEVGDRLGQDVDYEIPHDKKVLTALNLGEPRVLKANRRFGWGRAMRELIEDVDELSDTEPTAGAGGSEDVRELEPEWKIAEVKA